MRRGLLFSVLLVGGAVLSAAPASAGLLDALFGLGRPAPQPYAPLEFDVRPRARATVRPHRPRFDARKELGSRKNLAFRAGRVKAAKIDPVADPDWRFKDPTLRRGDIVVLPSGPVVFQGAAGDAHEPEDFAPLAGSRVASTVQRQVRMMVAGRWMAAKELASAAERDRRKIRRSLAEAR